MLVNVGVCAGVYGNKQASSASVSSVSFASACFTPLPSRAPGDAEEALGAMQITNTLGTDEHRSPPAKKPR